MPGTVGGVRCVLWVLPSPVPRIRELPDQEEIPAREAVAMEGV